MTVSEAVALRRATPSFQSGIAIEEFELIALIDKANLAPSGSNLQPWEFLLCHSVADKSRLQKVSYNQKKIGEASAVLVVLGTLNLGHNAVRIGRGNVALGLYDAEKAASFAESSACSYEGRPEAARDEVFRCGGIWAMTFMILAKEAGWDTAPMGGFEPQKVAEEFQLPTDRIPILVIAIGKLNPEVALYRRAFRIAAQDLVHVGNY